MTASENTISYKSAPLYDESLSHENSDSNKIDGDSRAGVVDALMHAHKNDQIVNASKDALEAKISNFKEVRTVCAVSTALTVVGVVAIVAFCASPPGWFVLGGVLGAVVGALAAKLILLTVVGVISYAIKLSKLCYQDIELKKLPRHVPTFVFQQGPEYVYTKYTAVRILEIGFGLFIFNPILDGIYTANLITATFFKPLLPKDYFKKINYADALFQKHSTRWNPRSEIYLAKLPKYIYEDTKEIGKTVKVGDNWNCSHRHSMSLYSSCSSGTSNSQESNSGNSQSRGYSHLSRLSDFFSGSK